MTEQIQIENFSQAEHEAAIKGFAKTIQMHNQQRAYFDEIEQNKTPRELGLLSVDALKQKYGFKQYKRQFNKDKREQNANRFKQVLEKANFLADMAAKSRDLVGC